MAPAAGGSPTFGSRNLDDFDERQLEEERARRKRKRAELGNAPKTTTSPMLGESVETAIDLTDSASMREDTPMNLMNSGSRNDVTVKVESDSQIQIAVKVESESEGEQDTKRAPRRKRARKEPPPALYIARIRVLAATGPATVTASGSTVDDSMMERIKKCLARYNHPNTPEREAMIAFRTASRLMEQHNITRSEVETDATAPGSARRKGESTVSLTRTDGDKSKEVKHLGYVDRLCTAMGTFFDCKHCTTARPYSLDITFYGIAENTITAALAFEMAYNLVAEWARLQKGFGPKNSYCIGASYQLQVMAKEEKEAEEARAVEAEKEAIAAKVRQEEIEDQARLDRLEPVPEPTEIDNEGPTLAVADVDDTNDENWVFLDDSRSAASSLSDDTEFNGFSDDEGLGPNDDVIEPDFVETDEPVNIDGDLDEEIRKHMRSEPRFRGATPELESVPNLLMHQDPHPTLAQEQAPSIATPAATTTDTSAETDSTDVTELESGLDSTWASHMQLMTFRKDAMKIADEHLEDKGVKLKAGRKRSSVIRDRKAYLQGKEDGKKIDVHHKKIKEEPAWEDEIASR